MKNFFERHYKKIVFLILLFVAVVSLLNAKNESAIFDETAHIGAGYSYLSEREIRLNPEHPPLIKNLSSAPLLFLDLNFNINQPFWMGDLPRKWDEGQWASGRSLLYESGNDADQILFWSRFPIVILSLILGWFIFHWTRSLAGLSAGLFALTLYAFDPNMLGHNHFVTTDLGAAAFFTFAFYFYLRFIKEPSWKNVALAGIFLGLLQIAKFSFMIGLPVLAFATIVYPLVKLPAKSEMKNIWRFRLKKLGEYVGKGFLLFLVSMMVVWVAYFFNTLRMSPEIVAESINFNFPPGQTENIKEVYTHKTLHFLNSNSFTRPLAIFGEGIGYVFRRVAGGNGAYFMQEVSSTAFPAYFPTVFILKEPLVSLALMLLALLITFSRGAKAIFHRSHLPSVASFIRHNIVSISLLLFILLYSYVSITGNLNIGFRHLFPILPFIYILTAKVLFDFLKRLDANAKNVWRVIFFGLAFFLILETILAYPFYMSYFNQIAGGPKEGYRYVTDSNADWGQDLKRLEKWIENYNAHKGEKESCKIREYNYTGDCKPIKEIHVNYFGGGDIKYYLDEMAIDWWDSRRPIEPGWYAISVNHLQGSTYDKQKPDHESYRWLKDKEPLHQVGTSIFIYHLTAEEAREAN
jgi:hypothetical protein